MLKYKYQMYSLHDNYIGASKAQKAYVQDVCIKTNSINYFYNTYYKTNIL